MNKIANLPKQQRTELFSETATGRFSLGLRCGGREIR